MNIREILNFGYLPRVEGHLMFTVDVKTGNAQVEVMEGVRLFEGFVRGRKYDEVPYIVSRICGLCPCSHNLCAIKAIEDAFEIQPSEQTIKLRKLIVFGEVIQSHLAHLYLLALPDYMGVKDVFDIYKKYPEEVKIGLKLRENANYMLEVVGGRPVHPISTTINGFLKIPTQTQLKELLNKMKESVEYAVKTVELFAKLEIPNFERKTEYVALKNENEYGLYDGKVVSSEGLNVESKDYMETVVETVKPYSTAKFSHRNGKPFYVGALARVNLNKDQLNENAKKLMENMRLNFPSYNPYHNNLAQALEVVHCVEESIRILEELLSTGLKNEKGEVKVKPGKGGSVVEAPRGVLYHSYVFDEEGYVKEASVLTPTAQNVANMEEDIRVILPTISSLPRKQMIRKIESLIRAYDPCISCSVHLTQI